MRDLELKVVKARSNDVGRGKVRIDPIIMDRLGITTGDVVQITGKKSTVAICWPGCPEDEGFGIIRIDGFARRNAGIGIDDKVRIKKIEPKIATEVKLAPTEPLRIVGGETYLKSYLENRAISRGDIIDLNIMGRKIGLVAVAIQPCADAVIINYSTEIEISEKPAGEIKESKIPRVAYEDIGGLREEIRKVREMIELPLKYPEVFERLGVEAPKGVLLYGPPGTGKTLLARAVANETDADFHSISGPEIMSKFYGESEENLRKVFEEAKENAPSIIFIDELDAIAPKREEVTGEVERRVVAQLLSLMDGLESRGEVVVIGATNRPDAIDPALRRPGRFDREIVIGVPDRNARKEILQIHTRGMPLPEDEEEKTKIIEHFANKTHGFVGADLEALCKEAAMRSLRRILPEIDFELETIPADILEKIQVGYNDFQEAFMDIEPSAMREVLVEVPDVNWSDIGGLDDAKQELKEAVEWPLKYPEIFEYMDASPPNGILLFGPPGTGKTMLAKAVANESEANFISVKGPEFLSKWVGESEKAVRETFKKARQAAPCVVFMDEIDSIVPARGAGLGSHVTERVVSQILTELDGLEELRGVVVIGATNRPDIIDPALLRPGRFDRLVYIPPPDKKARLEIFKLHTKNKPLAEDVNFEEMVENTEGYTGADIASVCNEAVMLAIREFIKEGKTLEKETVKKQLMLHKKHFESAIKKIRSISKEELRSYEEVAKKFHEA